MILIVSGQMALQNFPDSTIYQLDNLPVLRGMNSETVDLIATDPVVQHQEEPVRQRQLLRGQLEVGRHRHNP